MDERESFLSGIRIEEYKNPDAWDRYVFQNKNSGYCHLFNWSRVLEDACQLKSIYLAAVRQGAPPREQICGMLPLFMFKKVLARPMLVSVPFFDTAGVLADDKKTERLLIKKGADFFSKERVCAMALRQDSRLRNPDMKLFDGHPDVYREKVGLKIELQGSQQQVMAGFRSKLRSQIRKGEKNGLTWKIGKKELLAPFYQVFSRNMRDLGSPVHSKRLFNAVLNHFKHHAFICVVFYRSKPVAASFMIRFKNRLSNPWASSLRAFRPLNSNMFLYWQMIRFACNMGMDVFDMGRSSKGAATYRFKKQWGPGETQLYWYQWTFSNKSRDRVRETLTIEPWKKLPVKVANLMGPVVRKKISL